MSQSNTTFATADSARTVLKDMYPNARQIVLVEHGYDNIVGLIDEDFAVRFPRNADAYSRSQYEKSVLNSLGNFEHMKVPKVLGEQLNPACLITSFLQGASLKSDEVNKLTPEAQETFAKQIAQFAYELHASLSVEKVRGFRQKFGIDKLDDPWDSVFKIHLRDATFSNPKQAELVAKYFGEWQQHHDPSHEVVVHDDLHAENMLFEDGTLIGVLDFGDTNIGTPEQELGQLYRINETVLQVAVEAYSRLSGATLSFDAAKAWAIVQEMSSYSDRLSSKQYEHPSFIRACNNLNKWLPEGGWGKE